MLSIEKKIVLCDEDGKVIPTMEEVGAFTTSENRLFVIAPDGSAIAIFDKDGVLEGTVTEPLPSYELDIQDFAEVLRERYYFERNEEIVSAWRDGEYKMTLTET